MRIEFRTPCFQDREWIAEKYRQSGSRSCEGSFVNIYLWGRQYSEVAQVKGFLVQLVQWGGTTYYAYPAGEGEISEVIPLLMRDAEERGIPFRLLGVNHDRKQELEALYPGCFSYEENRDSYDYIYLTRRLAELSGKKLQSKRNHCNRFEGTYPGWAAERLTPENLEEARQMAREWYGGYEGEEEDIAMEKQALFTAFSEYEALGLEGLILRAEGRVVAFTMGNRITEDTFDVNFEKAFPDINGAYSMINREFARYILQRYPDVMYLNREDDMGIPGLRRAKESYLPDILLEKFVAVWEREG